MLVGISEPIGLLWLDVLFMINDERKYLLHNIKEYMYLLGAMVEAILESFART